MIDLAGSLIGDRSEWIRWQCAIVVGDFVETHPKLVWPIVARWGSFGAPDSRLAIACCVLEHLLQHHFPIVFPQCEALVAARDRKFLETLSMCWLLGKARERKNAEAFQRVVKNRPGERRS